MTTVRRSNGSIFGVNVMPRNVDQPTMSGIWDKNEYASFRDIGLGPAPTYTVYLLIAGGGAGGGGGCGGAGGLVIQTATLSRSPYTITIGAGGAVARDGGDTSIVGKLLINITGLGGGAGGGNSYGTGHSGNDGHSGGSGGGAAEWRGGGVATYPGAATQPTSQWGGYGHPGSNASPYNRTGSGGGAGGAPIVNTSTGQNNGGIGIRSLISGISQMYCTGGSVNNFSAVFNTTGAGSVNSGNGGGLYRAGGSGILIISYKSNYQQGYGGTTDWYVNQNGEKWWTHTFTNSGTYLG